MGKKLNHTKEYLIAQDKTLRDKMKFVETQGDFLKKVLEPFEILNKRYPFILDEFYRSATQLPKFYGSNGTCKKTSAEVREWPGLSSLLTIEQPMTQDKMKSICHSISDDIRELNYDYEMAIIEFGEGFATINDGLYDLSNSVVNIEVVSVQEESYDFTLGDRLNATVYIHNKYGHYEALLEAIGPDGKNYYFELKHFSILFLLDETYRLQDEENEEYQKSKVDISEMTSDVNTEDIEAEHEKNQEDIVDTSDVSEKPITEGGENPTTEASKEIRKTGAFVLFDESKDILFATTY